MFSIFSQFLPAKGIWWGTVNSCSTLSFFFVEGPNRTRFKRTVWSFFTGKRNTGQQQQGKTGCLGCLAGNHQEDGGWLTGTKHHRIRSCLCLLITSLPLKKARRTLPSPSPVKMLPPTDVLPPRDPGICYPTPSTDVLPPSDRCFPWWMCSSHGCYLPDVLPPPTDVTPSMDVTHPSDVLPLPPRGGWRRRHRSTLDFLGQISCLLVDNFVIRNFWCWYEICCASHTKDNSHQPRIGFEQTSFHWNVRQFMRSVRRGWKCVSGVTRPKQVHYWQLYACVLLFSSVQIRRLEELHNKLQRETEDKVRDEERTRSVAVVAASTRNKFIGFGLFGYASCGAMQSLSLLSFWKASLRRQHSPHSPLLLSGVQVFRFEEGFELTSGAAFALTERTCSPCWG